MKTHEQLDPTIFLIFGGAGDLACRKLIPAMFDLSYDRNLPDNFSIVVIDRLNLDDEKIRERLHEGVKKFSRRANLRAKEWSQFSKHIHYLEGDFKKLQTYKAIKERCTTLEKKWDVTAHHIYYMATPPSMFGEIPKYLGKVGLARDRKCARIVIEKPIGYDLESARALNAVLAANFDEFQIFRIDHYLGKETVQNILAFRFANPLFEPIWNRRYIDYVTITAAEDLGVEHRGAYYDHAGALRDMVQNHLLQLLCLVAMEPMVSFEADEIRNKKVDVLHAVRPINQEKVHECVVRGQYGPGRIDGKKVCGYRDENDVSPDSQTETFVALRLFLDNWRWQGVPFYLRTGKRLTKDASEIMIQFRPVPHQSFPVEATLGWQSSRLILSIHPDEGIVLRFQAKYPGAKMHLSFVDMQFNYQDAFAVASPSAYETLLWDLMKGDATLFMRADQVEAAWRLLMPVLDAWAEIPESDFPNYAAGSFGPEAVQGLLEEGHSWPLPTDLRQICERTEKKEPKRAVE
ncbi:MAG TPA: glucose-6-phosphate dehydrogenase [Myxococcota bacterium]|nr:glucose-6-phosphate dehydrogenase [Myxococcota bacterium]